MNIDIVKMGGHKLSALEIEEALRDRPKGILRRHLTRRARLTYTFRPHISSVELRASPAYLSHHDSFKARRLSPRAMLALTTGLQPTRQKLP